MRWEWYSDDAFETRLIPSFEAHARAGRDREEFTYTAGQLEWP